MSRGRFRVWGGGLVVLGEGASVEPELLPICRAWGQDQESPRLVDREVNVLGVLGCQSMLEPGLVVSCLVRAGPGQGPRHAEVGVLCRIGVGR